MLKAVSRNFLLYGTILVKLKQSQRVSKLKKKIFLKEKIVKEAERNTIGGQDKQNHPSFLFSMKKAEHIEGKGKCSKNRDTLNTRKLKQTLFSFLKYLKGV